MECQSIITTGEPILHTSLARKASSDLLNFKRLDNPSLDPPEWNKHLPIRLDDGEVITRELDLDYHLQPPYALTYDENFAIHCELDA